MTHFWRIRTKLGERYKQPCRIVVRGKKMNSILVEFEDGFRVVTSRYAVRRIPSELPESDAVEG